MHPLLEELHVYHRGVSATIDRIKQLLKVLGSGVDEAADCEQLYRMLESLHGEAETKHHQNEELIREKLLATEAPLHQCVRDIERDHQGFERIAKQLGALEQSGLNSKEIAAFVEDYIRKYYDHMDREENIFFPMADEWIMDEQWQDIKQHWQQ
ncbi:hemerythrin domain-containing protein [Pseudomonas sp. LPB0260]|uniref:hemerythrin domain-containing protein n=1 Tax=unclassified Pseudomonas TaxID=196821 RepID=UPI0015C23AFF|nr:hemerythrin domain-containing protein [Pseudomonas sp. LPB0260]QLC72517.1 hemerythrin domain-containing protein [Pseudomonas sp. LPB0260]QLC75293.1 hemerythrin domain-containing protein [Pseudomonas sp. LPB0260]